ncbi:MAG: hypothetical protein HKO63_11510 [Acidimicrobiia bacterium]|nr:hypothetical protein [Acidimicrobiia bacterium]
MKTLTDPICGMTVDEKALRVDGYEELGFCSEGCRTTFLARQVATVDETPAAAESSGCCGGHGCHQESDTTTVTS